MQSAAPPQEVVRRIGHRTLRLGKPRCRRLDKRSAVAHRRSGKSLTAKSSRQGSADTSREDPPKQPHQRLAHEYRGFGLRRRVYLDPDTYNK
jgi:hypothetical protein